LQCELSNGARSEQSPEKSFLFLLPARRSLGAGGEEKIGRAQNKKCRENFFAGWRASASGGGTPACRRQGASKFAVRIFVKKSSDFNQKAPQKIENRNRKPKYKLE